MTIKKFIGKAIEGGWDLKAFTESKGFKGYGKPSFTEKYISVVTGSSTKRQILTQNVLLDPRAWEAVGKVEGWGGMHFCDDNDSCGNSGCYPVYRDKIHQMIDHLIQGGTIESYLETL